MIARPEPAAIATPVGVILAGGDDLGSVADTDLVSLNESVKATVLGFG